tara:strand:- start:1412 stop:2809 length:1398 start_codon:yes stop_codon:yes gene_type:complete
LLTQKDKISYSIGAIPNGIKVDMFTFFLLFYYGNVVGLEPGLAGLAIALALFFDAFTDPIIGSISDRTNSSIGRRHPYLFASLMPIVIGYIFLFMPRSDWELSQLSLFIWMLTFCIITRFGMTLFDVPHRALGGEITMDYDERTSLFSLRELLAWLAGLTNAFLGYYVFFSSTPEYPKGQLNPDAWFPFGYTGAAIMAFFIITSSLATIRYGRSLSLWKGRITIKDIFMEIKLALTNRTFVIFFFGSFGLSIAWGLGNTLTLYINTYFWELTGTQITAFLPMYTVCAFLAFVFAPRLVRLFEKRNIILISMFLTGIIYPAPLILGYFDLTPPKGTYQLVIFLWIFILIGITNNIIGNMIRDSMVADIADEVELITNKRQEGVLFAALGFLQKVNTGFGTAIAGFVLSIIGFTTTNPTDDQIFFLISTQGGLVPIMLLIPIAIFYFYNLDREKHRLIQEELKLRKL